MGKPKERQRWMVPEGEGGGDGLASPPYLKVSKGSEQYHVNYVNSPTSKNEQSNYFPASQSSILHKAIHALHPSFTEFSGSFSSIHFTFSVSSSFFPLRLTSSGSSTRWQPKSKLRKWEAAARDYEVLLQESPRDEDVAKALFEAQMIVKKQHGEEESNTRYGDIGVVKVESSKRFKNLTSWPETVKHHHLRKQGFPEELKQFPGQFVPYSRF